MYLAIARENEDVENSESDNEEFDSDGLPDTVPVLKPSEVCSTALPFEVHNLAFPARCGKGKAVVTTPPKAGPIVCHSN